MLEKRHIKLKGKNKIKYSFVVKTEKENVKCPYLISGKCTFDWKDAAVTDYFPPEYEETD
jgi:hypothetical protein